jgi:hypothetical protein
MPTDITQKEMMIQALMSERTVSDEQKKKILLIIKYLEEKSQNNEDIDVAYEIDCLCEYIDWK